MPMWQNFKFLFMILEIFTLCDHAQQDAQGKLTIVGTFDAINHAGNFPLIYPHCAVALRMRFADSESGNHAGYIAFKKADRSEILVKVDFSFTVLNTSATGYTSINMPFNMGNFRFPEDGKYVIELYLDSEWQSGLTVAVNRVRAAA